MSKWCRGTVLTLAALALLAGSALAGPGDRLGSENGDPDRPEIAVPVGKLDVSTDSVDAARDAAVTSRSERTPSEIKVLFRVYLKLFRIFLR